jgi:hypothetical protein
VGLEFGFRVRRFGQDPLHRSDGRGHAKAEADETHGLERLQNHPSAVLCAERLHGDETTVPVLAKARQISVGSGVMSVTIGPSAAPIRRPPCSTIPGIVGPSISTDIPASFRPTPTRDTTACMVSDEAPDPSCRPSVGKRSFFLRLTAVAVLMCSPGFRRNFWN